MTASVTVPAATLGGPGVQRAVFHPDEFASLVDSALANDWGGKKGTLHTVYAEDVTVPPPRGRSGKSVLVLTVNSNWGAAYYRERDRIGQGWAWITHNPRPAPGAPALLFDPEAGTDYPAEAAIPVRQLRRVVEEYLRTGERPAAVEWRPADRYLIY